jgi:hypothetical protein
MTPQSVEARVLRFSASWWPLDAIVYVSIAHYFDEVGHVVR